jgi:hypothetical protein
MSSQRKKILIFSLIMGLGQIWAFLLITHLLADADLTKYDSFNKLLNSLPAEIQKTPDCLLTRAAARNSSIAIGFAGSLVIIDSIVVIIFCGLVGFLSFKKQE